MNRQDARAARKKTRRQVFFPLAALASWRSISLFSLQALPRPVLSIQTRSKAEAVGRWA